MNKNIELRLRYNQLIIKGKDSEAFEVLKQIWNLDKPVPRKIEEVIEIAPKRTIAPTVEKIKKKKSKYNSIKDLAKIKGIGVETVKDLKKMYSSLENLIDTLKKDGDLPLRNDIVNKLKKEFK